MRTSWLVAIVIMLLSMNAQASSPVDSLDDSPSARLLFALDPFEVPIGYSVSEGNAKELLVLRFGEPMEETVSTVPTRFPDETYTSYVLRYTDVIFRVGKWPDREYTWIETIEINGNAHGLKSGIRIGSSREQVISAFSPPDHYANANPVWVFANIFEKEDDVGPDGATIDSHGALYRIAFEFDQGDYVTKISISFSID